VHLSADKLPLVLSRWTELNRGLRRLKITGGTVRTHWNAIIAAKADNSPTGVRALGTLCQIYWLPFYSYGLSAGMISALPGYGKRTVAENFWRQRSPPG
jgi:hypothetical protein